MRQILMRAGADLKFGSPFDSLKVHVRNIWVLRALVIVLIVRALGKYMIIEYLDLLGL